MKSQYYTHVELISHVVATHEATNPNWTARDTLNFLKSHNVDPHESYGVRCGSNLCQAGKGLAARRLHSNDIRRASLGWKIKSSNYNCYEQKLTRGLR